MEAQFPHDDFDDRSESEKYEYWAEGEMRRLREALAIERAERSRAELRAERAERRLSELLENLERMVSKCASQISK